jgi:hypothetical protein
MSEATVLTSENAADFYAQKLGLAADTPTEAETKPEPVVEEEKQSEPDEATKEATGTEERKPNPKLERRFSEITKQREAAREEARKEREAREALEARLRELESKANPVPESRPDEDEEPMPSQFEDAFEYAKSLADWSTKKALRERDKQEADRRRAEEEAQKHKGWADRIAKAKSELPDFDDMVASSDVVVSNEVREAIIESDVGPQVLYYLAENPDFAEKLAKMSSLKALREIGKLEARLEKSEPKQEVTTVAAKSNAPAPISPLKATSAVADIPISAEGQFSGSYAQWKAARKAGKIR